MLELQDEHMPKTNVGAILIGLKKSFKWIMDVSAKLKCIELPEDNIYKAYIWQGYTIQNIQ